MKPSHCFSSVQVFLAAIPLLMGCMPAIYAQSAAGHKGAKSKWVYVDDKGALAYKTLEQGDKIMDFSYAGYMGGGVALPVAPV
ncbi:MAG TPA: hypothetical protein VLD19_18175, partial [Chitinophagaceae bacterium]|nr:hypothetical protein [Chitinophagaceae bacterium]